MNGRKRDSTGQLKSPKVNKSLEVLKVDNYLKHLFHLSIYLRMISSHSFKHSREKDVKNFQLKSYPHKYNFSSL